MTTPEAVGGNDARGPRGEGRAIIEAQLKGGKTTTAKEMRAAWGDRPTPLSVALASYVKSGFVSKKGKGRQAVFTSKGSKAARAPARLPTHPGDDIPF